MFFNLCLKGQNYNGYLGKKNLVGLHCDLMFAFSNEEGIATLVPQGDLRLEYSFAYWKYFELDLGLGASYNQLFKRFKYSSQSVNLGFRYFKKKTSSITPIGKYIGVELNGYKGSTNKTYASFDDEYFLLPKLIFGNRIVTNSNVYFDTGFKVGIWPIGATSRDNSLFIT